MAGDGIAVAEGATFTQEQIDAIIEEKTAGLKANRDEVLREAKAAKERLKSYEGVDPEEHKKLKAQAEEAERKKATAEGDFKALEKQLIERHTAELQGRDAKMSKMEKALHQRLVQAELRKTIADGGGMSDMTDLLLEYGAKFVRVKETDDGYEAYVVDANGNQRIADGQATPMSIGAFVESELKTKYPRAFAGTGSSGSGTSKSTGGAGGAPKVIAAGDGDAFLANVEGIANGTVKVAA